MGEVRETQETSELLSSVLEKKRKEKIRKKKRKKKRKESLICVRSENPSRAEGTHDHVAATRKPHCDDLISKALFHSITQCF